MDTIDGAQGRTRRRHSAEFKARMIQACSHTGVSIAAVALANGLNANLLRNWVVAAKKPAPATSLAMDPAFVPLAMAPAATVSEISIEVRRGEATVHVRWPLQAAGECAAWLRIWLR